MCGIISNEINIIIRYIIKTCTFKYYLSEWTEEVVMMMMMVGFDVHSPYLVLEEANNTNANNVDDCSEIKVVRLW